MAICLKPVVKKSCFVVCALFGAATLSPAGLILTDSFDYANGPLVTASNSPWLHDSGATTGEVSVVSGRVFLSETNTEDVHAPLSGAPYTAIGGTTLYVSFTLNVTSLPTYGGGFFAELKSGSTLHGRIFTTTAGEAPGAYRLGVANGSLSPSVTLSNDLSTNVNYTVVLRYVVTNATSTLWLNPSAETNASVTATDAVSTISISYFGFREGSTNMGDLHVDNLLVGTAFSDVVTNAPQPPPLPDTAGALSLLTYNLNGNGKTDWSTNATQVQAIGRQLMYLKPDIITFNEIPATNIYEMANWVAAYLPGYFLATNSVTDGYVRSGIASRYPIARSTSWLPHADLNPFGYTNSNMTRDFFEAEIKVPDYCLPLHVFVAHLKSTGIEPLLYQDDANRRAAEAAAISNFFVNVFLPGTNGTHPYVVSGDMNEDIWRPDAAKYVSGQPLQRLISAPTGLRLATPVNPVTGSDLTESIRLPLDARFDYILPCGLLFSNLVTAQVFRTDVLNPLPPGLVADDAKTASDHLPVIMYFSNPDGGPFRVLSLTRSNPTVSLTWESISNRLYRVDASSNLSTWGALASNLTATGTNFNFVTNVPDSVNFFRVYRVP
jgi:endonuclease/exonuclease/phosphatase family metal-dependent hydrolase